MDFLNESQNSSGSNQPVTQDLKNFLWPMVADGREGGVKNGSKSADVINGRPLNIGKRSQKIHNFSDFKSCRPLSYKHGWRKLFKLGAQFKTENQILGAQN